MAKKNRMASNFRKRSLMSNKHKEKLWQNIISLEEVINAVLFNSRKKYHKNSKHEYSDCKMNDAEIREMMSIVSHIHNLTLPTILNILLPTR